MKKIISVLLAVCLMLGIFCVMPIAASAEENEQPHTLTVGVVYSLRQLDDTCWYVHYWNDETVGDVNLTPLGYHREKNLTGQYQGLDTEFIMYSAEVPAEATGYCIYWADGNQTYWFTKNDDGSFASSNTAYCFHYGPNDDDFRAVYLNETQTTKTVYFTNARGWKKSKDICVHYWTDTYNTKWRGVPMTYLYDDPDSTYEVYSAQIPDDAKGIIFNGLYGENDEQQQTGDITGDDIVDQRNYIYDAQGDLYHTDFAPAVKGHTLSLKDEIGVNFYVYYNPYLYNGAVTATYVYGTGDYRKERDAVVSVPTGYNNGANLRVSCPVNARAMTDVVTMTLKAGDEVLLTADYKVVDYCEEAATAFATEQNLKDLLCSMLEYGGTVQRYFGYNTDDYADNNVYLQLIENPNWVSPEVPDHFADDNTDIMGVNTNMGLNDGSRGVFYKGAMLSASGKTTIYLYFDLVNPENRPRVYVNNTLCDFVQSKNADRGWYISIPCSAQTIFDDISILFSADETESVYIYNAANYYNAVMASEADDFVAAQPVLKKMYAYYVFAKQVN